MIKLLQSIKGIICLAILVSAVLPANAQEESPKNLPNFLLPEFTKSIVKFKSGQTKTAVINYNIVDEEIVFMQDNGYMVLDNPQAIDTIFIASRRLIPFNVGFYELVVTGHVNLFVQHKSNAEPVGTPTGYGVTTQTSSNVYRKQIYGPMGNVNLSVPDGFKLTDATQYWISKDNSMEKFSSKRQFLKIFKDKEKELNKFFDGNSISFKNLSDMIRLINYCNELYN